MVMVRMAVPRSRQRRLRRQRNLLFLRLQRPRRLLRNSRFREGRADSLIETVLLSHPIEG